MDPMCYTETFAAGYQGKSRPASSNPDRIATPTKHEPPRGCAAPQELKQVRSEHTALVNGSSLGWWASSSFCYCPGQNPCCIRASDASNHFPENPPYDITWIAHSTRPYYIREIILHETLAGCLVSLQIQNKVVQRASSSKLRGRMYVEAARRGGEPKDGTREAKSPQTPSVSVAISASSTAL